MLDLKYSKLHVLFYTVVEMQLTFTPSGCLVYRESSFILAGAEECYFCTQERLHLLEDFEGGLFGILFFFNFFPFSCKLHYHFLYTSLLLPQQFITTSLVHVITISCMLLMTSNSFSYTA